MLATPRSAPPPWVSPRDGRATAAIRRQMSGHLQGLPDRKQALQAKRRVAPIAKSRIARRLAELQRERLAGLLRAGEPEPRVCCESAELCALLVGSRLLDCQRSQRGAPVQIDIIALSRPQSSIAAACFYVRRPARRWRAVYDEQRIEGCHGRAAGGASALFPVRPIRPIRVGAALCLSQSFLLFSGAVASICIGRPRPSVDAAVNTA